MSEQIKKRQRIYDFLKAEFKATFLCLLYTKQRNFFLQKKSFLRKIWSRVLGKKLIEGFLASLSTAIKRDPTTSKRKHANELKVHEKSVRTAIKQDSSPDLSPIDYAIWSALESKTNATSHTDIASLKTAIEKEWKKCIKNLFWRHCFDTISEKNGGHIEFYCCLLCFKIKINLVL